MSTASKAVNLEEEARPWALWGWYEAPPKAAPPALADLECRVLAALARAGRPLSVYEVVAEVRQGGRVRRAATYDALDALIAADLARRATRAEAGGRRVTCFAATPLGAGRARGR